MKMIKDNWYKRASYSGGYDFGPSKPPSRYDDGKWTYDLQKKYQSWSGYRRDYHNKSKADSLARELMSALGLSSMEEVSRSYSNIALSM